MKNDGVCLIYLPHPYLKDPTAQAPVGLLYIAAVLEKENIPVVLKNYSSWNMTDAIEDLPDCLLYGITATSLEIPIANEFSRKIKWRFPRARIIVGGPGVASPRHINLNFIDCMFFGEAESMISRVYKQAKTGTLPINYVGKNIENLDEIPFPARHLLDNQGGKIFAYGKEYKGTGSTIILSSRGCPHNCAFCASPSITDKKVRFRSPKNVAEEIKHVIDTYDIRQIRFSDDMFTANRKRVLELCKLLKPLDIVWRISCRAKPCDDELFQAMYDAGLREMSIGVESFDDNVLKFMNKGITVADNVKCLETCAKIGIKTRILFMIRTPGQTLRTVERNIEMLEKVPYDIVACTTYVPIPGSDIWNNPDKYDIEIINKSLEDYNFYFFGKEGQLPLKDLIRFKSRDMDEVNRETKRFRDYLISTGKLNEG